MKKNRLRPDTYISNPTGGTPGLACATLAGKKTVLDQKSPLQREHVVGSSLEYSDFNVEKAKQYLKKSSKKIALRLIENKDEENLVKLLKIDFVPKQLLEMLLEKAEEMPTARAYILEMLGNTKTNKSFSI